MVWRESPLTSERLREQQELLSDDVWDEVSASHIASDNAMTSIALSDISSWHVLSAADVQYCSGIVSLACRQPVGGSCLGSEVASLGLGIRRALCQKPRVHWIRDPRAHVVHNAFTRTHISDQ